MAEFLFKAVPNDEAIDFISSKPVVSREVFDELLPELQARAFTITGVELASVQQAVRDLIAELPAGTPWKTVVGNIVNTISPYMVDPNAPEEEKLKQQAAAQSKAELLLRVHGQEAYSAAAWRVMDRQRQVFKYWQYQTMGDARVRAEHKALDGITLPANSPFWQRHFPPWDWGCRCIAIPISDSSLADEKRRNPDAVLDEERLRRLEQTNVLEKIDTAKGTRQFIDVAPPAGKNAFRFQPGELTLPADELKKRYDPQTWSAFEKWARRTEIPSESRSVWNWINGEPGAPFKVPAPTAVAPLPTTQPEPAAPARKSPVSDAMDITIRDRELKGEMQKVLDLIDATHDDGAIPELKIQLSRDRSSYGYISFREDHIGIRASGDHRELTLAHEIGHAIDWYALPERTGIFASEQSEALLDWKSAVQGSDAIKRIDAERGLMNQHYFLSGREMFARSYSQYIALKTQDARLIEQINAIVNGTTAPWRQWAWEDFQPIADAFDDLFIEKGWIP
jgi:SPP1 gp7 family putative phage head morphogenesis protein